MVAVDMNFKLLCLLRVESTFVSTSPQNKLLFVLERYIFALIELVPQLALAVASLKDFTLVNLITLLLLLET
jgi:hypothetical protein